MFDRMMLKFYRIRLSIAFQLYMLNPRPAYVRVPCHTRLGPPPR
jgi:hypothetical protein